MASFYFSSQLSDESKLICRFAFASILLSLQCLMGKKVYLTISREVSKVEGRVENAKKSSQHISTGKVSMCNRGAIFFAKPFNIDERKFKGRSFMLRKRHNSLRKEPKKKNNYHESLWSQLMRWKQRKLFQIIRIAAWRYIPFFMTYSIPEPLEILGFQIRTLVKNRVKTMILISAIVVIIFMRHEILPLFNGDASSVRDTSEFLDLFTLHKVSGIIQPGDRIEVMSVISAEEGHRIPPKLNALKNTNIHVIRIRIGSSE